MLKEDMDWETPNHQPRSDVWPLSVFERRFYSEYNLDPKFDSKLAAELLVNATITALSMNERYEVVNGTITGNFNIYHFQHKLAFFLPYSLTLDLAIPIIAIGLIALHIQNIGVSAISGGFVQLLMTTTGHTAIESVVAKESTTLGAHEICQKSFGTWKSGSVSWSIIIKMDHTINHNACITLRQAQRHHRGSTGVAGRSANYGGIISYVSSTESWVWYNTGCQTIAKRTTTLKP
jgi:hypothetical protein